MLHWQDVALSSVINLPHISMRAQQRKCTLLLSLLQKVLPKPVNLRSETRLCKVIDSAPDDLISREPQQPPGAGVRVQVSAVAVRDQNRLGRMIENCPEQQLEFFQTVFNKPAGLLPHDCGAHNAFFLRPNGPGKPKQNTPRYRSR